MNFEKIGVENNNELVDLEQKNKFYMPPISDEERAADFNDRAKLKEHLGDGLVMSEEIQNITDEMNEKTISEYVALESKEL